MNRSHVWIGYFTDDAPEDYFSDQSHNRGEDEPINQFASEQGEMSFDYDFTEISFAHPRDAKRPREFVDGHSYSETYLDKVVILAQKVGLEKINVFVIANENEFATPRSVMGKGYQLEYLGLFETH